MALPTYDKSKRRKNHEQLPKGAYVVKIMGAKEETGQYGRQVAVYFDIAEGEYKGFYNKQYEANTSEDKQWPYDGIFYLSVPGDGDADWIWNKWNTFFADLEDSNSGFIFGGDLKKLKDKLIGGVFHIKQSQGKKPNDSGAYPIYSNTKMKWTCVAEDVRKGKITKFPDDVLVGQGNGSRNSSSELDGFVNLPEGAPEKAPWE